MAHKTFTGVVTSDLRDKTITVTVTTRETHPLYGKQYTASRKYQAHDEKNEANRGDKVTIEETRPFSKTKSFVLRSIDERAKGSIELKDEAVVTEKGTEVK
ncbi:MAG TPA: 30S ribosomal protein S17 [Patescibacteria group bacterium]|jgi:small subunit ribosomal protein S17|nr:30S ribosomal protein S17 [Patescibacteria group bacterium]